MKKVIVACLATFIGWESPVMAGDKVTLASLLDEMISFESVVEFPDPYYTCKMISSYDRRTGSPDKDWWYNLDGIPFQKLYKFDIEMMSWEPGKVDYAVTNYWYGDLDSKVELSSGKEEVPVPLPYLF